MYNNNYNSSLLLFQQAPQPDGITLDTNENMTSLIWDNPGNDLPSSAIQILVNDSMGAVTLRNISVILCACENNGTCINATSPQYNSHGHYRQPCDCPESFSGDLCEIDDRNCSDTSCPESAMCVVNTSVAAGFTCSQCQDGYELADDGKCTGIKNLLACNCFKLVFSSQISTNVLQLILSMKTTARMSVVTQRGAICVCVGMDMSSVMMEQPAMVSMEPFYSVHHWNLKEFL